MIDELQSAALEKNPIAAQYPNQESGTEKCQNVGISFSWFEEMPYRRYPAKGAANPHHNPGNISPQDESLYDPLIAGLQCGIFLNVLIGSVSKDRSVHERDKNTQRPKPFADDVKRLHKVIFLTYFSPGRCGAQRNTGQVQKVVVHFSIFIFEKIPWYLIFKYLDESLHLFKAERVTIHRYLSRSLCIVSEYLN